MKTVVKIADRAALVALLAADRARFGHEIRDSDVAIVPYRYDDRIGWTCHIVTVNGRAEGFTDGPLPASSATP